MKDKFSDEKTGRLSTDDFASHTVITDQEERQSLITIIKSATIAPSLRIGSMAAQSIRQASRDETAYRATEDRILTFEI